MQVWLQAPVPLHASLHPLVQPVSWHFALPVQIISQLFPGQSRTRVPEPFARNLQPPPEHLSLTVSDEFASATHFPPLQSSSAFPPLQGNAQEPFGQLCVYALLPSAVQVFRLVHLGAQPNPQKTAASRKRNPAVPNRNAVRFFMFTPVFSHLRSAVRTGLAPCKWTSSFVDVT